MSGLTIITRDGYKWCFWKDGKIEVDDNPGPQEIPSSEYDAQDLRLNVRGIDWPATDAHRAELDAMRALGKPAPHDPSSPSTSSPGGSGPLSAGDVAALLEWHPPALDDDRLWALWAERQSLQEAAGAPSFGTLRLALAPGGALGHVLQGDSWRYWRAWLYGLLGESLTVSEYADFYALTGRPAPPGPMRESWAIAGRRSGKTESHSVLACFLASKSWGLPAGERALIAVVGRDAGQAKKIFERCEGIVAGSPQLSAMVERVRGFQMDFNNGSRIEVHACSFRGLRGYTMAAFVGDEVSFWRDERTFANPADEVLAAVRPALGTLNGWLLCCTSPYGRGSLVHTTDEANWGVAESDVAILKGPTHVLNSTFSRDYIERQFRKDPARAKSEWLGQYRDEVEGFVPVELVDQAIESGVELRPPEPDTHYTAFLDPSGGVSDSMTLAIAHRHGDLAVLDVALEVIPPFSPRMISAQFAEVLRRYDVGEVISDRVGGVWVAEMFAEQGIVVSATAEAKSILYGRFLPLLSSGQVRLLDDPVLRKQLLALERKPGSGGRDIIDHPPNGHDDVVNAAVGALVIAMGDSAHEVEFIY